MCHQIKSQFSYNCCNVYTLYDCGMRYCYVVNSLSAVRDSVGVYTCVHERALALQNRFINLPVALDVGSKQCAGNSLK